MSCFVMHPAAYRKMTKGPGGLVDKHISKITRVVEVACEVESPSPGRMPRNRTMINYATGGMARSIASRTVADGVSEVEGKVWVGAEHAKYVLHGTSGPYQIPKICTPAGSRCSSSGIGWAGPSPSRRSCTPASWRTTS